MLFLIETFRLQDCLLHEDDDSWNFQFKGETDKKVPTEWFNELAEAVFNNTKPYLQARSEIEQELRKCPFEKDKIMIIKMLKPLKTNLLPGIILRNLRDEIMFNHLDTLILDQLKYKRYNRTYNIKDTKISHRLARDIARHNSHITNMRWLQSFFYSPRWP